MIKSKRNINKAKVINKVIKILLAAPSIIAFVMVVIIPFVIGVYYSFTDWTGIPGKEINMVGISNYIKVFGDPQFIHSFITTLVFSGYAVILINVIGFFLALLVTQKMRSANLLRTIFFMPNLIGGLILGYVWKFIFLKITPVIFAGAASMLSSPHSAILAMVIVKTWQMGGYVMVIYVAAIQAIPPELIEAAHVDGANTWHRIKSIIFPMVAPAFTVSLFLTLGNSFKMYDVNLSLTNGDPGGQTKLIAMEIIGKAFNEMNFGVGQAQAVIFFIVISSITLFQVYVTKKREVEM